MSSVPVAGASAVPSRASAAASIQVWAVASYRAGENSQVFGLASRLGLPWRRIDLRYKRHAGLLSLLGMSTPSGISNLEALSLGPTWPDLIISSGMKNEPLCRWIRRQSGGRTRLVFIGRTWARDRTWDLLITTPQYRVKPAPNVIENRVTLQGIDDHALQAAAVQAEERFGALPRPRTAVLIGGSSGPHCFGERTARDLAGALRELQRRDGGGLILSTSSRTPAVVTATLRTVFSAADSFFYEWRPQDPANPYMGMMACADRIVVTSDSVAMASEAAATGKPVYIYDLDKGGGLDRNLRSSLYRLMMRYLPKRLSRDLHLFHQAFIAAGYGNWLGGAEPPGNPVSPEPELARTVERVRALLPPRG